MHLHHEIIGAIYRRGPEAEGTSAKFSSAVPVSVRRVTGEQSSRAADAEGRGKWKGREAARLGGQTVTLSSACPSDVYVIRSM